MRKFEFNSKFRFWRFRIGHPELRTNHSELLFQSKGFTLIEIIVLIVMAGIIIPTIVVPFATGIRGSKKPEMVATAMYLAHQKMEELMKFDYCQASLNTGTTAMAAAPVPFSNYQWGWTISYVTNTFATSMTDVGYKQIVVTVTDPQGSTYVVYSVVTH